jgi:methylmalonyl-CoA mutase
MAERSVQKMLQQNFPVSDIESWKQLAISESEGNDLSKLSWSDEDGNNFLPYYTREHLSSLEYLNNFNRSASINGYLGNCEWFNMPAVTVTDAFLANTIALNHLSSGADGILFSGVETFRNLNSLLKDIEWQFCRLSFSGIDDPASLHEIRQFVSKNKIDQSLISGNLFWETIPHTRSFNLNEFDKLGLLGIVVKNTLSTQTIAIALQQGAHLLLQGENKDDRAAILKNISFSIPVETNFLLSITKIKTLRLLWYQIARSFGFENFHPDDLHIHCRSEKWVSEKFQPHSNMLKSTTAAMAAIIGGCDSLTIMAEDQKVPVMDRIATNVSNILREESYFNKVADPLAGSYVIAQMTDTLARQAWSHFQNLMKNDEA